MSGAPDINSDARQFIAENAFQTAYWSDVAREAATIREDALVAYAGVAKDMLLPDEGAAR